MKTGFAFALLLTLLASTPLSAQAQQGQYQQRGSSMGGGVIYSQGTTMGGGITYPSAVPIGRTPYYNQPGYGYYAPNPNGAGYPAYGGGYGYPAYGAPVQGAGGYFQFGGGASRGAFYWKSPSGYYYPWGGAAYGAISQPIIVVQQGQSTPAQPPVSDMFKDIRAYLEEQNGKSKFLPEDYNHLSRRLRDIMQKEALLANRNGGSLDGIDEETIRKDLNMLSADVARRVKP
ncbi:MAG: hypothetical protein K2W95_23140 [Candidatus Obscuribacterales bacterium]|nr:hypothetical protein [Candidatus Obscuribacterales bacterium]